jgi:N-methylhydantoinase A/oxoprolinase/acetone carboxylase beta subunit
MTWVVGIDIGGRFTDLSAAELRTGQRIILKTLTTPDDPLEGVLRALGISRAAPLVPRELRFGVAERMDAGGSVVTELDSAALAGAIADLRAAEVEAVAVAFLHSYQRPARPTSACSPFRRTRCRVRAERYSAPFCLRRS